MKNYIEKSQLSDNEPVFLTLYDGRVNMIWFWIVGQTKKQFKDITLDFNDHISLFSDIA